MGLSICHDVMSFGRLGLMFEEMPGEATCVTNFFCVMDS